MPRTIFDTPIIKDLFHLVSIVSLRAAGWRTNGALPDIPKFVLIAAPHTSNWDFTFMMFIAFKMRTTLSWMGKDSLFKKPFAGLFKWMGGIPIDRSRSGNIVDRMVERFHKADRLILAIAPSGTRKNTKRWKSGFYHIAAGAGIPVVMGFLDYKRKIGGIGPVLNPTGDMEADLRHLRRFYNSVRGKHSYKGN